NNRKEDEQSDKKDIIAVNKLFRCFYLFLYKEVYMYNVYVQDGWFAESTIGGNNNNNNNNKEQLVCDKCNKSKHYTKFPTLKRKCHCGKKCKCKCGQRLRSYWCRPCKYASKK